VTKKHRNPGSIKLGKVALDTLNRQSGARAVILANHGLLTIGGTLIEAFGFAENIEQEARIYYLARSIGTPRFLTQEQFSQIQYHYLALKAGEAIDQVYPSA
jgi:L-fuculose-phosphate aldolase